jgi:hypothetical protein
MQCRSTETKADAIEMVLHEHKGLGYMTDGRPRIFVQHPMNEDSALEACHGIG